MWPSVALRKEVHDALTEALGAKSETGARRIMDAVTEQIREANRKGIAGPPVALVPYDVERVVLDWRARNSD
jgi:hypothetical protein